MLKETNHIWKRLYLPYRISKFALSHAQPFFSFRNSLFQCRVLPKYLLFFGSFTLGTLVELGKGIELVTEKLLLAYHLIPICRFDISVSTVYALLIT